MDRIGHRKLQLIGFAVMTATFAGLAAVPSADDDRAALHRHFRPLVLLRRIRAEHHDVRSPLGGVPHRAANDRSRGCRRHREAGAFVGVFVVPQLQDRFGLRWMLAIAALAAIIGFLVTLPLPEPAGRALTTCPTTPGWARRNPRNSEIPVVGAYAVAGFGVSSSFGSR